MFNGQESVLWKNVRDAFGDELSAMYKTLRSMNDGDASHESPFSYYRVAKLFTEHQSVWPEAMWNEDAFIKYLQPYLLNNEDYLGMLQGNKASQRDWWLFNAFRYRDSKYRCGDAEAQSIKLRCYAVGDITITPYSHIYGRVKYGSYTTSKRCTRNQSYVMECGLDQMNDTETYVYSADRIASVGDLSHLLIGQADFSAATKLQNIKLGDEDPTYENLNLGTGSNRLSVGSNDLLTSVNIANCKALGTGDQKSVDFSGCIGLKTLTAVGTKLKGVDLPNGGRLETLRLPATLTNFTIRNQKNLQNLYFEGLGNLETLYVEGTPNVPIEDLILENPNLNRVRLINVDWTAEDTESLEATYEKLLTCAGMNADGSNAPKAVVEGTVRVNDTVPDELLNSIAADFPELVVVVNGVIYCIVVFRDWDATLLDMQRCVSGGNVVDPVQSGRIQTPTRQSTAQYDFTYIGWNGSLSNVTRNMTLVAQYRNDIRSYAYRFLNNDGTVLKSGTADYGTTVTPPADPSYVPEDEDMVFEGWLPSDLTITGDTDFVAQYRDIATPLSKYLARTMTEYESDTADVVAQYAFYQQTVLLTVKTSATTIGQYAFYGCTALTTVDLTDTSPVTIQANAFYGCAKLTHVIIRSTTVSTLSSLTAFAGSMLARGKGAIYVPADLVDDYKAATNWSNYAEYIYPITAYPVTDFSTISDSWSTIIGNANYATDYKIGDTKLLDLGMKGEVYMELVAMDTDDKADGSGKARMTWLSKDIIEIQTMNTEQKTVDGETAFTAGGWENTDMRAYLKNTIKPLIPQVVREAIVEVTKVSGTYTGGARVVNGQNTTDDVWIPSSREMYNSTAYETTGAVYSTKFKFDTDRVKYDTNGVARFWWLRSTDSATSFRCASQGGAHLTNSAKGTSGLVLGFCI